MNTHEWLGPFWAFPTLACSVWLAREPKLPYGFVFVFLTMPGLCS
jgi:hypothetical protein